MKLKLDERIDERNLEEFTHIYDELSKNEILSQDPTLTTYLKEIIGELATMIDESMSFNLLREAMNFCNSFQFLTPYVDIFEDYNKQFEILKKLAAVKDKYKSLFNDEGKKIKKDKKTMKEAITKMKLANIIEMAEMSLKEEEQS